MSVFSVCALGSSHTAALKQAWTSRLAASHPRYEFTFFASKSLTLSGLSLEERVLVPMNPDLAQKISYTSGGQYRIDIDRYDAFLIIALGFKIDFLEWFESYGLANACEGVGGQLLSRQCFLAVVHALLDQSLAVRLIRKIRSVSDRPIMLCPTPFPLESLLPAGDHSLSNFFRNRTFLEQWMKECVGVAERIAEREKFEIVWSPAETSDGVGFTKSKFGLGAIRVKRSEGAGVEDGKHMNEDYGELTLNRLLARLNEISPQPAAQGQIGRSIQGFFRRRLTIPPPLATVLSFCRR